MNGEIACRLDALSEQKPTKSQRRLIRYFRTMDLRRASYLTITELARETDVAEATVLRFCRALGFEGYQDFRAALAYEISADKEANADMEYFNELDRACREALEACRAGLAEQNLRAVNTMIAEAGTVCCFGDERGAAAATELKNRLISMGFSAHCERDVRSMSLVVASRDGGVLVIFSAAGTDRAAAEIAELARASGCKLIVVTCEAAAPIARYADVLLKISLGDASGEAARLAMLFAANCIAGGLYLSDKARFDPYLARSGRAIAGMHF